MRLLLSYLVFGSWRCRVRGYHDMHTEPAQHNDYTRSMSWPLAWKVLPCRTCGATSTSGRTVIRITPFVPFPE